MIHDVRKRIKKIRAVLRLVRSELKQKDFKRYDHWYQLIGHVLSPMRDATVMAKTLENLGQMYPHAIATSQFAALQKALTYSHEQQLTAFAEGDSRQAIIQALQQAPRPDSDLRQLGNGFAVLEPNLKNVYQQARKALHVATQDPSNDHYHDLRKKVKTLGYYTRLLKPIWPRLLKAYGKELKQLGELLGDDHDCGVLAEEIKTGRLLLQSGNNQKMIVKRLFQQQNLLRQQIHPLAERLLAEKPEDMVGRCQLYWKLWQAEADQEPQPELYQLA